MTPLKSRFTAHRVIEGEGFVVDTRIQLLHHLNPVGAVLWGWIDGRRKEEALAKLLTETYDVDDSTALSDVRVFLKELREQNLIEDADHEPLS